MALIALVASPQVKRELAMVKNVLVGVDGRSGGHDALALALRLVGTRGQVTLVHVHEETTGIVVHDFDTAAREEAHWLLEGEREAAGPEAKSMSIAAPSVGAGLHSVAEQNAMDLLVVGTCSHGLVGRVLLGDDTRASLDGAPCAVAIAPLGYAQTSAPIGVIGVGYDASPESDAALALARVLAADSDVKVRALSVVSVLPYAYAGLAPMDLGSQIETLLGEARNRLDALDGVEGRAAYGLPGEELTAFGEEVGLLLVGSRSYGPARHLMLGSTSRHLTRTARCPLVILPRTARKPDSGQVRPRAQATLEQ